MEHRKVYYIGKICDSWVLNTYEYCEEISLTNDKDMAKKLTKEEALWLKEKFKAKVIQIEAIINEVGIL